MTDDTSMMAAPKIWGSRGTSHQPKYSIWSTESFRY